jgi:hypothetical protein
MIKITTPKTVLPPAGYRIYCEEIAADLTDEHVLSHDLLITVTVQCSDSDNN